MPRTVREPVVPHPADPPEPLADVTGSLWEPPIGVMLRPFRAFAQLSAAGGLLLGLCTILALVWANSPWSGAYDRLWGTYVTVGGGQLVIRETLGHWVNDGLMAIFFFVVGLEIKREVLIGELASPRRAALPIAAAIGGMAVPALFYVSLNRSGDAAAGWGIPMATDIAFALGVLALLGSRVPPAVKVFLTALAIVDDLGAVLVIALFYTASISWTALAWGAGFLGLLVLANRLGVRRTLVYAFLGVGVWAAFLASGIHATIAGVLVAMTIPSRTVIDADAFVARGRAILAAFDRTSRHGGEANTNEEQQAALQALEDAIDHVEAPMQRLEHALHPWVAFLILPIFALANAGLDLSGDIGSTLTESVTLGVMLGLVLGKPIGVTLAAWLAVRTGIAAMPVGVSWRHVHGAGWLAGIGFTMSLFIAALAFGDGPELEMAKLGILAASVLAGTTGWVLLRTTPSVSDVVADTAQQPA
jgi:NhaA family Na+:H+ antiporter